MPRIARIAAAGYPYHIIQRGNNRQVIFFDDKDKHFYLNLLRMHCAEYDCAVHAYCLMNDHAHILTTPQRNFSLSKVMLKLSLRFTQYFNKKYRRTGRLWECRYYSSLIEKDAYLWAACRYIERNPVRANVVERPLDYEWSSAVLHKKKTHANFLEPIWQNESERESFIRFLNEPDDEKELSIIRRAAHRGLPAGTANFIKQICKKFKIKISKQPRGRPLSVVSSQ